ncbi:MAG: NUDIX domain-containing protein [Nitrososphaerota archaeon]|nr:NUDIX domain-containing protein [Nitrososphaerota archaeon]
MIEERSAGAVVFLHKPDGQQYLLLDNGGRLDFPKGQLENGETELDAAKRETKEETGLDTVFIDGFLENVSYFYSKPGGIRVHKMVTFFIAESKSAEVKISKEHQGFVWLPFKEALRRASYTTTRALLVRADDFLRQKMLQKSLDAY